MLDQTAGRVHGWQVRGDRGSSAVSATTHALVIELIVWHHKRRTRRLPYSAAAYLLDPSKPENHQVLEAGSCSEAGTEHEAARNALRELQERRERQGKHDPELVRALSDPVGTAGGGAAGVRVVRRFV